MNTAAAPADSTSVAVYYGPILLKSRQDTKTYTPLLFLIVSMYADRTSTASKSIVIPSSFGPMTAEFPFG